MLILFQLPKENSWSHVREIMFHGSLFMFIFDMDCMFNRLLPEMTQICRIVLFERFYSTFWEIFLKIMSKMWGIWKRYFFRISDHSVLTDYEDMDIWTKINNLYCSLQRHNFFTLEMIYMVKQRLLTKLVSNEYQITLRINETLNFQFFNYELTIIKLSNELSTTFLYKKKETVPRI